MQSAKMNNLFNIASLTVLVTIVLSILLYKSVPIEFYNLTRVIMFCSLGFISFFHFKKNLVELSFFYGMFALLFNPLYNIFLGRNIWLIIDVVLVMLVIYSFIKIKFNIGIKGKLSDNSLISDSLKKVKNIVSKLEFQSNEEWEDSIHLIGTKIGHLNEIMIKELCIKYNVKIDSKSNEELRKELKDYLPKNAMNDIYYLNQFRNKIVHHNESDGYMDNFKDISNLDSTTKKYFNDESKMVVNKAEAIYNKYLK